jgi:hypothetical protein
MFHESGCFGQKRAIWTEFTRVRFSRYYLYRYCPCHYYPYRTMQAHSSGDGEGGDGDSP